MLRTGHKGASMSNIMDGAINWSIETGTVVQEREVNGRVATNTENTTIFCGSAE